MTDTLPRGTISGAQPASVTDAASPSEDRCALITLPETAAFDATTTNAPSADIQSAEALPAHGTAPVLSFSPTERGYGGCMGLAAAATTIPNLPAYLSTRSPTSPPTNPSPPFSLASPNPSATK
jgi:hypothetical protein